MGPPTAQELASRKAENATFWIYAQLLRLNVDTLSFPDRWRPDSVAKTLHAELYKKILPVVQPLAPIRRDPRFTQVETVCRDWAQEKYCHTPNAVDFGERLVALASDALILSRALAYTDVVLAAAEILTERKHALPSPKKIDRLDTLLKEFRFSENRREAIRKKAHEATQDPVVDLLEEFFSDRQWRRFLDRRGRARRIKLPSLTEARVNLVDAFLQPEKTFWFRGPHPEGLSLLPSEA